MSDYLIESVCDERLVNVWLMSDWVNLINGLLLGQFDCEWFDWGNVWSVIVCLSQCVIDELLFDCLSQCMIIKLPFDRVIVWLMSYCLSVFNNWPLESACDWVKCVSISDWVSVWLMSEWVSVRLMSAGLDLLGIYTHTHWCMQFFFFCACSSPNLYAHCM